MQSCSRKILFIAVIAIEAILSVYGGITIKSADFNAHDESIISDWDVICNDGKLSMCMTLHDYLTEDLQVSTSKEQGMPLFSKFSFCERIALSDDSCSDEIRNAMERYGNPAPSSCPLSPGRFCAKDFDFSCLKVSSAMDQNESVYLRVFNETHTLMDGYVQYVLTKGTDIPEGLWNR